MDEYKKPSASGKKGMSNWGGRIIPVLTLYVLRITHLICLYCCVRVPCVFHDMFTFLCYITVKHDLWMTHFVDSLRIFQALYAGNLQRVSEVDGLVARKVARGIGGIQTNCPENMVLLTLYHKGTTLGRCCSTWV